MEMTRVLRILEYIGTQEWVEATLKSSYVKGTRYFGEANRIHSAIIEDFPEILRERGGEGDNEG